MEDILQSANARSPISTTLLGIDTEVRLWQDKNAPSPILVIPTVEIQVIIQCTDDGGDLTVYCGGTDNAKIVFKDLNGNQMKHKDGYRVKVLDSLEINGKTYKNILEFDATEAENNACDYDKAYIAANKGLIRIDLQDSITIERTTKKATERTPVD